MLQRDAGFTLIEAMMVLVILAILVALALPSVQGGLRGIAMQNATQEVMHLVDFARVQAQTRNRAYELSIDKTNHTITINESANTKCSGFGSGLKTIRQLVLNAAGTDLENIRIMDLKPSGFSSNPSLCFRPDGSVLATATGKPVQSTDTAYGAGDAVIVIQRTQKQPSVKHSVVIPYNGIPSFQAGG